MKIIGVKVLPAKTQPASVRLYFPDPVTPRHYDHNADLLLSSAKSCPAEVVKNFSWCPFE
jgi:hypothetical protein